MSAPSSPPPGTTPADLRVLFMGTPAFAAPTLQRLIDLGCHIVGVVSQPDRPQGRGRQTQRTPTASVADAHGLPTFQWPRLNNDSYATLSALRPDLCVVVAYGKILPQRYLDLPRFGCLNGHASLLPKLRGAAPIQWSVIEGHAETGTCIMRMEAGMDTGPVALVRRLSIGPDETSGELHDRLSVLTAEAMGEAIERLCRGELRFEEQDHSQATIAPMLSKQDGLLDFAQPAQRVHDRVRGLSPWPGAWVPTAQGPLKILATRPQAPLPQERAHAPGTVLAHEAEGPRVACAEGSVILLRLQRPGRGPTAGDAFLRGAPLPIGAPLHSFFGEEPT